MAVLKKINYKIVSIALLCALMAVTVILLVLPRAQYTASFCVTGDVQDVIAVDTLEGLETHTKEWHDQNYRCVPLTKLIDMAAPLCEQSKVVICGDDGMMAVVDLKQLDGIDIAYTAQNGWEVLSDNHPPSSNIKRIVEVWVVADEALPEYAVNIISDDENIASYTPGQFFMSETASAPLFHGQSETMGNDGNGYEVAVYTTQQYRAVTDIAPEATCVLVMGEQGQYAYDAMPGKIVLAGNELQYVFSDGKTTIKHVRGIIVNPPSASNMDVYAESANNLNHDERVMVVLIDGFGYHQYAYATQNGYAPTLAELAEAKKATTVYKPVTYSGMAAMLTGQPPYINGVYQRGMPDLNVPDIFEYVEETGKTPEYIEGNIKILNTSIDPVLNADRNENDATDDEVFEAAMAAVQSDADYIFVHFHGVDDMGHTFGDLHSTTLDKVREVDGYIGKLLEGFHGRVIITTDHGMHETQEGGDHGIICYQDMIIPYISCVIE